MRPIRKVLLAGVAVCAVALGGMSVALACTPGGGITADPGSGPPGSFVDISGTGFVAAGEQWQEQEVGPVEIRWNTTSGPLLATATGPDFTQSVTVPQDATNRTYYFVAVQRRADGGSVRQAAASFQVTGAKQATAPPPAKETQQPPAAEPAAPPAEEAATAEEPVPAPAESSPAPAAHGQASQTADAATAAAAAARRQAREADAAAAAALAASRQNEGVVAAAPPIDPGLPGEAAPPPPAPPAAPEVSPLSVSGDLAAAWQSGFSNATGPSLTGPVASAPAGAPAVGLGLLGLGTAGLLGGAFVGLRSRRRAVAGRSS